MVSRTQQDTTVTVIRPRRGWLALDARELWQYRELFAFLVWRDLKVRYKQTLLGFAWAVIVPLATTLVFTILFGRLGGLPTDGLPQPVFYMAGLVIWRYFSTSVGTASNSLVGNQPLLTKVYFPRLIVPGSTVVTGLMDLLISFGILVLIMLYYDTLPAATSLLLPGLVGIAVGTALGAGLLFSALNVRYRDIHHLVPFLLQLWMYVTVIVPFSRIPESVGPWRYLYGLNPMAGVVEGFRWCLAHHQMPPEAEAPWVLVGIGLFSMAAILLVGLLAFKRMERQFADIV